MSFWDRFRRAKPVASIQAAANTQPPKRHAVGAVPDENPEIYHQTFTNNNITFNGELQGYNYNAILRDKQGRISDLYSLADYYVDADPIIHGIVRHVYLPYTTCSPWILQGVNGKTAKIYEEYYKQIRLREKLEAIAYEYWKYSNVFVYVLHGVPITLPVNKCKIGNTALNGEPIVDFDCQTTLNEWRAKGYQVRENWIHDNELEESFKGFPEEVVEAMNRGDQYAQLNPKYTKVLQGPKEGWHRYSIPFIAACLTALETKEIVSAYEKAVLNLGVRSFVHVGYGDPKEGQDMLPDIEQLRTVRSIFSRAMSGFPLAVTNHLATAKVVQPKLDDLFQWDKYRGVNNDILSAGGINGILVSGLSQDGSTFATAQVSMQTAASRIESARDEICELMNKINICIQEELANSHIYNVSKVPTFAFMPLDMNGRKALREACEKLWQQGVVSTDTMMRSQGYSLEHEKAQREAESADGTDRILLPRADSNRLLTTPEETEPAEPENPNEEKDEGGRPKLDNDERTSDPEAAMRGKQPKPSNPDGSMGDEGIS